MLHETILAPPNVSRIAVMQGEVRVSSDPNTELNTVLGSCVATCLYDPEARIGGMNHFLLSEPPDGDGGNVDVHYGTYLMELLVNQMLRKGAIKSRLRAHLYGGGHLRVGLPPIGDANAEFARQFIRNEGIVLSREDLGGTSARKLEFRAASGQARCRKVADIEPVETTPKPRPADSRGDVELF